MKKTGAQLVRFALEQLGVKYTFGIPGVHNTEIYDELNMSADIQPVLVTHEGGGSFMADAISRTSDSIGTMLIVPAAGVTHAASGIGEASLDGIPMLIISGGINSESGHQYQLHDMDQHALLKPITKATFKVLSHEDVISTFYQAYDIATHGEPGPVFIEMPYNISNFKGTVANMPSYVRSSNSVTWKSDDVSVAIDAIKQGKKVGIFAGWGAANCEPYLVKLAELLNAPVATTLQGLSVFPANHPLHTGMGMGKYAVPAATNAFEDIDCLIAIGTRFSEIPTGSFGINPPENLIHIDINEQVFNANYPAKCTILGDATQILPALVAEVAASGIASSYQNRHIHLAAQIKRDKAHYVAEWFAHNVEEKVNPARFLVELRKQLKDDAIVVADDGNHTFLAAELLPIHQTKHFISPSDFNAMGYCVPATVGAKLANPTKQVVGIVGDGGFLMTGMETLTATNLNLGAVIFIFNDGELSQISQAQEIPYNRKTCTVLASLKPEGVAIATGANFVDIQDNGDIETGISRALLYAEQNKPVIVNVNVDYSKRTRFTQGVVKTNLKRFSTSEKIRAVSRAVIRKVTG
ncbi:thiamine pyrophosphate-binding protein [Flocculibacter collagenilyticus]|uniref:thiamine pyrophosphate-binding protein n=1 Tax=Flocculibacter collagenilyticus TaxID=2744479 RepID=UPI0018F78BA2|nr:thiamine pyrophosphate-binding protein [Flocculibacter collagenilyticus]